MFITHATDSSNLLNAWEPLTIRRIVNDNLESFLCIIKRFGNFCARAPFDLLNDFKR